MDRLRTPFFVAAAVMLLLAILGELSSVAVFSATQKAGFDSSTPGWAIRYLAILDALLLYTVITWGLGLIIPRAVVGRVQGIVALVLSFLGCLWTIVLAVAAFVVLILMVTLLMAVPFGTLAYMVAWGDFPASRAEVALALIMTLKIAYAVLLVLAQQDFLKDKALVFLSALSLGLTWLVAFLIGFPPFFLVSIVDVACAFVIAIIGIVLLALVFIGAIVSLVSLFRSLT